MTGWKNDLVLIFKDLGENYGWSERCPEWVLFALAVLALSFVVIDPFNVFW